MAVSWLSAQEREVSWVVMGGWLKFPQGGEQFKAWTGEWLRFRQMPVRYKAPMGGW
jgi:hypothetical protein